MSDLMNIGGGLYLPDMAAIARDNIQNQTDKYALQRQQITDQRADDQYANTQAAASQAASGDVSGAKNTALAQGNFGTLDKLNNLDDKQQEEAQNHVEFVGRLVPQLQTIDGSDGGAARREAARPYLKQLGDTDAQIDAHDFSDNGLALAQSASMSIKDRLAQQREDREANKPITAADGAVLVSDGKGGYQTIYTPGTKPLTQVVTDPVTGAVRVVNVPGTPGQIISPGAGGSSGGSAGGSVGGGGFAAIDNGFEKGAEGGYADRDGASGAPVNFGINQKFNPDVDVKNLTPDAAQQIRKTRYWDQSGAGAQPTPAGQAVVYDTAINMGVPTAQRMIKETGGDPQKMLDWREQRYRSIAQNPANAKNLPDWIERNNSLRQYVGQTGQGGSQQAAPQANGPTITDLGGSSGPVWKQTTVNGVVGQMNQRTGEFHPIQGASDADPNDPAVDLAARQYVLTGKMPAMGNGGSSLRKAILEKAAVYSSNLSTGQIASLRSQYAAHSASLTQLQKQRSLISAQEDTALNSWDNYLAASQNAPGTTTIPALNGLIQFGARHLGNSQVVAMDNARTPAIDETTRVLTSGPSGNGQITDSATAHQNQILSPSASVEQKRAARDQLKLDMDGRLAQWDAAIQREQGGIDNLTSGFDHHGQSAPAQSATRPTRTATNPQTGQKLGLINGQWVPLK